MSKRPGKRYGVNVTRTITIDQTVYVTARSDDEAMEKVQAHYDAGKGGDAHVTFKKAIGLAKDADGGDINETVSVDDAWVDE